MNLVKEVCTQCEICRQEPYDVDAILKELSRYFIPLEDIRKEVEEAKDKEELKTLCNLCRGYQIADPYYHKKLSVPSSHEDADSLEAWDDLAKFTMGIHSRSKRMTQAQVTYKIMDIIHHFVGNEEAYNKSIHMSSDARMRKILFTLLFLDRQGHNTSKTEREVIRGWRKQFSIRELAFISDRSTSTVHEIVGYEQTK